MKAHHVTLRDNSDALLYQAADGLWACPICGSVELKAQPYFGEGATSFEMCSCGFEFGFDDDPGASSEADEAVQINWSRWRARFLSRFRLQPRAHAQVVERLRAIGVESGA
jgi:hypothetical protein